MKFTYTYRSSDGQRHSAEIEAESRDDVYVRVRRELGIKPINVVAKEVPPAESAERDAGKSGRAEGKAWNRHAAVLAAILILAAIVGGGVWWRMARRDGDNASSRPTHKEVRRAIESDVVEIKPGRRIAKPRPRRQVPDLAGAGVRLEDVFKYESERVLALFAQPGKMPAAAPVATPELIEDFYDAMDDAIWIEPDDPRAVVDIKRIVAGLKEEAEIYLSSGSGAKELLEYLMSRQKMEAEYRALVVGDYDDTADDAAEKRAGINAQLKAMGLETIGGM